jgi:phosphate transport system substrate-binding protein
MLFYKDNKDPKKAAALRELVDYCLAEGQKMSEPMGYIPLPAAVVGAVKKAASSIQ